MKRHLFLALMFAVGGGTMAQTPPNYHLFKKNRCRGRRRLGLSVNRPTGLSILSIHITPHESSNDGQGNPCLPAALSSNAFQPYSVICTLNADGTNKRPLTNSFRDDWFVPQKTSPERDIYTLLTA